MALAPVSSLEQHPLPLGKHLEHNEEGGGRHNVSIDVKDTVNEAVVHLV